MQFNNTRTINELREFQAYAYGVHGSTSSQQLAVPIAMDILTRGNAKKLTEGFPVGMLKDFTTKLSEFYFDEVESHLETRGANPDLFNDYTDGTAFMSRQDWENSRVRRD